MDRKYQRSVQCGLLGSLMGMLALWLWFSYKRQWGRRAKGRDWRPRQPSFAGLLGWWGNSNPWGLLFPLSKIGEKKKSFFFHPHVSALGTGRVRTLDPVHTVRVLSTLGHTLLSGWEHWQEPMLNLLKNALRANLICWYVLKYRNCIKKKKCCNKMLSLVTIWAG